MSEDYRVRTGWRNHPKRIKLMRRLGAEGVLALYDLWEFCAESRTDGCLFGMDAEDIAIASGYGGDPADFILTLVDLRLLDQLEDGLQVHDWDDHNPYAAGAERRSWVAKKNNHKRWAKEGKCKGGTEFCSKKTCGYAPAMPFATSGIASGNNRDSSGSVSGSGSVSVSGSVSGPVTVSAPRSTNTLAREVARETVRRYKQRHPGAARGCKPGTEDFDLVEQRALSGYSADEMALAIEGNAKSPWWVEHGKHGIKHIFESDARLDEFIRYAREGPPKTQREQADDDWINEDNDGSSTGNGQEDVFDAHEPLGGCIPADKKLVRRNVAKYEARLLGGAEGLPTRDPGGRIQPGAQAPPGLFPDGWATAWAGDRRAAQNERGPPGGTAAAGRCSGDKTN